jgi:transcriptional regulator GlxA family with amidase domain
MTHRVGIFVFDGMTLLDVSGPIDVLRLADPDGLHYTVSLVSTRGGVVRTSAGVDLAGSIAISDAGEFDTVLVVGGENLASEELDPELLAAVSALSEPAQRVASVCTGAFVLAELGWLDERRATTHWRHADALARRYPKVRVEPDVIHTRDGRFLTSAGITAGIDLVLAIVESDLGAHTARAVARELVVFMQRPGGQSQYSTALRRLAPSSSPLRGMMDAVIADPAADHTVASMAREMGVSVRQANRVFQTETGSSPAKWVEEVRVDAARTFILDGHPITRVAQLSGFGSDETLRRAFARHVGTTPSAFRDRFSTTEP